MGDYMSDKDKGFGSMPKDKVREIAREGGKSSGKKSKNDSNK